MAPTTEKEAQTKKKKEHVFWVFLTYFFYPIGGLLCFVVDKDGEEICEMSAKAEFKCMSMNILKCFLLLIPLEFIDYISQKLYK